MEGKPNRDFEGDPLSRERPLVAISRMFGTTAVRQEEFYENVYAHYDGVIRIKLIEDLHEIDSQLPKDRLSLGYIIKLEDYPKAQRDHFLASLRIFDGSQKPWGQHYIKEEAADISFAKPGAETNALPLQRINQKRKLPRLRFDDFLAAELKKGRKIFEIGKFTIEASGKFRTRLHNLIELFLLRHLAEPFPDALIVVHVASKAHIRLYQRHYGFRVFEEYPVPGNPEGEAILVTTGKDLGDILWSRLRGLFADP
jgi:hypothetical protein